MDKNRLLELKNGFDLVLHSTTEEQVEYWCAREIMPLLGYVRWENFVTVIEKAKSACEGIGQNVHDHFRDVTKMVPLVIASQVFQRIMKHDQFRGITKLF